jgi:hypothetical protein
MQQATALLGTVPTGVLPKRSMKLLKSRGKMLNVLVGRSGASASLCSWGGVAGHAEPGQGRAPASRS